jgi:dethiobiotin synthetase
MLLEKVPHDGPCYIYMMGAASGAGKSTVCAGLLAWLTVNGYPPGRLAYIKPMTQCVEKQSVSGLCERIGITCRDIGNLVYRKGFTKDFINGRTPGSRALHSRLIDEIIEVANGKEVVVVDGVGGPADGSVIGVSNADVAVALRCPVVFVGKPGIGAAIDNTVLCQSFLKNKGIQNTGIIYNNITRDELEEIKPYVTRRIAELIPDAVLLGFIDHDPEIDDRLQNGELFRIAQWFSRHVNTKLIFGAGYGSPCQHSSSNFI